MNETTTRIKLYSDRPSKVVLNGKNFEVVWKARIKVDRSKDTLILLIKSDTLSKEYIIKPQNSFNYYANVLTYGLGFIWDSKSEKRYTYQRNIYLDYNSKRTQPLRFFPSRKGQVNLIFSLPHINSFYMQPKGESAKSNTGFWGISGGLDYYYKQNKFLNLSVSVVSDFFLPVPAPVDISGEYELMSSNYFSLTDNFQFDTFTFGYGINYSKNIWDLQYHNRFNPPPATRDPVKKSSQSIGLTFNGYYQLSEYFNIGLIYRPTFWEVKPTTNFKYEHLISIDLAWKWRIKN